MDETHDPCLYAILPKAYLIILIYLQKLDVLYNSK